MADLKHTVGGAILAISTCNPAAAENVLRWASTGGVEVVLDDIVYLPLHQQVLVWAMRDDFEIPVFPIGRPQFREVRFK